MFGLFKNKRSKPQPWDGGAAYVQNLYASYSWLLDEVTLQKVDARAKHVAFLSGLETRVDADHWRSLVPELAQIAEMLEVRKPVPDYQVDSRSKFLCYMLDAFANGERFIIAKLAYTEDAA